MQVSYNNLVYAMSRRACELANMNKTALKLCAGFNCDTPADAINKAKGQTRGELIEEILSEEFEEEIDRDIGKIS